MQLVKHVSSVIACEGAYSIEFAVDSHRRTLSIGFSEGKQLMCMPIVHCGRGVSPTYVYIDLMSRLLSAISDDSTVICCVRSSADFVKVLDKNPGRRAGVQYLFILIPLEFELFLHKPGFSVKNSHVFNAANSSITSEWTFGLTPGAADAVLWMGEYW